MSDRSDEPSHLERTLLPRSYISLWLEQEIAQSVHHEWSFRWTITPWANALTTELHLTLAGTRNSSISPPWVIDPTNHCTLSECSYHWATSHSSNMLRVCYIRLLILHSVQSYENKIVLSCLIPGSWARMFLLFLLVSLHLIFAVWVTTHCLSEKQKNK